MGKNFNPTDLGRLVSDAASKNELPERDFGYVSAADEINLDHS